MMRNILQTAVNVAPHCQLLKMLILGAVATMCGCSEFRAQKPADSTKVVMRDLIEGELHLSEKSKNEIVVHILTCERKILVDKPPGVADYYIDVYCCDRLVNTLAVHPPEVLYDSERNLYSRFPKWPLVFKELQTELKKSDSRRAEK